MLTLPIANCGFSTATMQKAGANVLLVDCKDLTNELTLKLAEFLSNAVKEDPWNMDWEVGSVKDSPSLHGTCCAFIKAYIAKGASFVIYEYGANNDLAGFAIGVDVDSEIAMELNPGSNENYAKEGDFYLAACIIEKSYRGKRVQCDNQSMSVYRYMTLLRLHVRTKNCTTWVRTHINQEKVRGMYESLGFNVSNFCSAEQGNSLNKRVVMRLA